MKSRLTKKNWNLFLPAIQAYPLNVRVLAMGQLNTILTPIGVFFSVYTQSVKVHHECNCSKLTRRSRTVKLYIHLFTPTILETRDWIPLYRYFVIFLRGREGGSRTSIAATDRKNTLHARIGLSLYTPTLADLCQLGPDDSVSRVFLLSRVVKRGC